MGISNPSPLYVKKINAQEEDVLGGVGYNPQHEETVDYSPLTNNPNLKIEKFVSDLQWPTTMDFINDDILILEKNSGNVRLIKNGELQENISLNNYQYTWLNSLAKFTDIEKNFEIDY